MQPATQERRACVAERLQRNRQCSLGYQAHSLHLRPFNQSARQPLAPQASRTHFAHSQFMEKIKRRVKGKPGNGARSSREVMDE